MIKVFINNEEVVSDKNITITEEMLSTSSTILNNCFPKSWETDKDYVSRFYFPKDYSKCKIYDDDDLIFCGVVKNTGNISLNPRHPHYCDLQILDFKTFLSEGETLDFVISGKTITEAIQMVIDAVSDYGVVLGNINILNPNEIIGAYSTLNKTAYDVFQYIADITQSRWTTRLIDDETIAVDFYDPMLEERAESIEYTRDWFEDKKIEDITFSYSTNDYRNKQIMLSNEVFANIEYNENIYATGYDNSYSTNELIGKINSIYVNGVPKTVATDKEKEVGINADFYYSTGSNKINADEVYTSGTNILVNYIPMIKGREIIINGGEVQRIESQTQRKGVLARYETRNDVTTTDELDKIGKSYLRYKGSAEIILNIKSHKNLWNVGQIMSFNSPVSDLSKEYMVKTKKTYIISTIDTVFYEYELTSSFNSENAINYFDNQRAKQKGNIADGEYISRNIDIYNNANIIFDNLQINEVEITGDNVLDSLLESPFID